MPEQFDQTDNAQQPGLPKAQRPAVRKGAPSGDRATHAQAPTSQSPWADRDDLSSPAGFTHESSSAAEPPLDPARTIGGVLSDPESVRESSAGVAAHEDSALAHQAVRPGEPPVAGEEGEPLR